MLTVLTAFWALVLTLIILVPVRPSRENVISMPSVGRNVWTRAASASRRFPQRRLGRRALLANEAYSRVQIDGCLSTPQLCSSRRRHQLRPEFLVGQQLIKICDGAREAILKHSARLPIEQVLGARNVGPALLWIVLRTRTVDNTRVRAG